MERGADDVRLEREPIAIAADELHHRLHAELLQRDGDGEWRGVRVRGGVVGRVDRVDVVLVWLEALVDRVEPAGVDGQQLRSQDEAARADAVFKPGQPCSPTCTGLSCTSAPVATV